MHTTDITHRPPRAWRKLTIDLLQKHTDTLCAILSTITDSGIEIQPGRANAVPPREKVVVYLSDDRKGEEQLSQVMASVEELNRNTRARAKVTVEEIVEQDWNSAWKRHFKPCRLSGRIVVKPSWEQYTPLPDELVIEIDPGMAFGTGLHASTRLALSFIEEIMARPAPTVLDVGTGTGILGMSCALMGAEMVIGIDNDLDARAAATANIGHNRLHDTMAVDDRDIGEMDGPFELVIANITADVLTMMAADLFRLTAPGGHLVLSGILAGEQAQQIATVFSAAGFGEHTVRTEDEWAAFLWRRQR